MRGLSAMALAFFLGAAAAQAGDARLAYFQPKTIFHSGLKNTHTIAMTFDDGPNVNTEAVLDALKTMGVKGTFFIVGHMAKLHPDVLARIATEGHLLANHSATHVMLSDRYDEHPELLIAQIRDVDDMIAPLMPRGSKFYFRAPYGTWRSQHAAVLNADPELKKYIGPIYWDEGGEIAMSDDGYVMSAADWECWHRGWDADTCAKGYLREIRRKNGGVVLMHCIHAQSAELAAAIVQPLIDEGYSFVRLDQIEDYQQYETPPEAIGTAVASAASAARNVIPK